MLSFLGLKIPKLKSLKKMSLDETEKAAVEADRNGNIDDAIKQYMTCVELILKPSGGVRGSL